MKHIVNMWRLTVRKILIASLGAVSLIFGSCYIDWEEEAVCEYGMPPAPLPPVPPPEPAKTSDVISGTVKDANGTPVPNFWVSVLKEDTSPQDTPHTFTNRYGKFELSFPSSRHCCYTLIFADIDGSLNGEFESQTVQFCIDNGPLNIVLEPKKTGQPGCPITDPEVTDPEITDPEVTDPETGCPEPEKKPNPGSKPKPGSKPGSDLPL
jgi:hypothetical protein